MQCVVFHSSVWIENTALGWNTYNFLVLPFVMEWNVKHMITAHLCIPYVLWDTQLWCYCLNCIHSTHPGVCYLHHSLNPSSLINPNKSQPQAAVSADTIPPALPRSTKAQEAVIHTGAVCRESERVVVGRKRRVGLNREAGDGGQKRGDSLGIEPIQLQAAVQPWFLWRHLIHISTVSSSLSWYPFLLSLPFPYTFVIMAHTHAS